MFSLVLHKKSGPFVAVSSYSFANSFDFDAATCTSVMIRFLATMHGAKEKASTMLGPGLLRKRCLMMHLDILFFIDKCNDDDGANGIDPQSLTHYR
jgi:hypothetical protein